MKLTGWRLWAYIALFLLFTIAFHPWWLAVIAVVIYCLLLWLLFPKDEIQN